MAKYDLIERMNGSFAALEIALQHLHQQLNTL
ncbi:MAG: DNA replication terminus site-binding protein, partial [Yersinia sp. (in: enterobacteria)]